MTENQIPVCRHETGVFYSMFRVREAVKWARISRGPEVLEEAISLLPVGSQIHWRLPFAFRVSIQEICHENKTTALAYPIPRLSLLVLALRVQQTRAGY